MCANCGGHGYEEFDDQAITAADLLMVDGTGFMQLPPPLAEKLITDPVYAPVTVIVAQGTVNSPRYEGKQTAIMAINMGGLAMMVAQIEHLVSTWPEADQVRYRAAYDQQKCRIRDVEKDA